MQKLPLNVRFWFKLNSLNVKWPAIIQSANPYHARTRHKIINKIDVSISLMNIDTSCILFVTASLIYIGTLGFNPHNGYIYYIHETSVGDSSVVKLTSGYPGGFFVGEVSTFPWPTSSLSHLVCCYVTQHRSVVSYRRFRTNLHCVNIPEEQRSHLHCGGRLKSQTICFPYTQYTQKYGAKRAYLVSWLHYGLDRQWFWCWPSTLIGGFQQLIPQC